MSRVAAGSRTDQALSRETARSPQCSATERYGLPLQERFRSPRTVACTNDGGRTQRLQLRLDLGAVAPWALA